jgi:corin
MLQGDSGGPLLCRDEKHGDHWFVGGIVSWGIKCAHPRLPGVYAYVPKYVPWIRQQMALHSNDEKEL